MLKPTLLSIGALLLTVSPLPAVAATPQGPEPAGDPGTWITYEDYPSVSLRDDQEGTVGFVLLVDPQGVPASCKVTQTSQFEQLDTQTCNLLMRRARFVPARDAQGSPVDGSYRSSVLWVIEESEPQEMASAEVLANFVIGTDGKQRECTVDKRVGPPDLTSSFAMCSPKARFVVANDKNGKPVARRVRFHMVVEVEDLPNAQ